MPTWTAKVKPGGKWPAIEVTVEARGVGDARRLLEAQYGKANVMFVLRA